MAKFFDQELPELCFYRFKSNYYDNGAGFKIQYESSVEDPEINYSYGICNSYFTASTGNITSPSYPGNYPDKASCNYIISQPIGTYIKLTFHLMGIEYHQTCGYDYLYIRDGTSNVSPAIGNLCGTVIPSPILSTQNNVRLR